LKASTIFEYSYFRILCPWKFINYDLGILGSLGIFGNFGVLGKPGKGAIGPGIFGNLPFGSFELSFIDILSFAKVLLKIV